MTKKIYKRGWITSFNIIKYVATFNVLILTCILIHIAKRKKSLNPKGADDGNF